MTTPKQFTLKLKRSDHEVWPWFSCDLGYESVSFHPRITINADGPSVVCMDVDATALIINDADRSGLYEVFTEHDYLMQTFFEVVILGNLDYPYPKAVFQDIARLDLSGSERKIVDKHLAGFTCLYLIKDHDTGLIKIGRSDNPERRLKELLKQGTLMPRPNNFTILRAWDDYPYQERFLHQRFANKRVRGEWFNLDDADIKDALACCHIYD